MQAYIIDLSDSHEWESELNLFSENQRDIYFTPHYYRLHEVNGDGKASCFIFKEGHDIAMYPFLKNSINELELLDLDKHYWDIQGAYGYNGIVSSTYEKGFVRSFHKHFCELCSNSNIVCEFTRSHPLLQNEAFFEGWLDVKFNRKTVMIDLTQGYEKIWNESYSSTNRNMLRKAQKNNLMAVEGKDQKDYDRFFELYTKTMTNVNASDFYFFNKMYFQNFKELLDQYHKLIWIKHQDTYVCGILLMYDGQFAHYHLSARDKEYSKLAINNLALDTAVKYAIELGCQVLNLGGGVSSSETDSLLRFKKDFSKLTNDFYIATRVHNREIYMNLCNTWIMKYGEQFKDKQHLFLRYRQQ